MCFYVDGACQESDHPSSIGAAATAVFVISNTQTRTYEPYTQRLPKNPTDPKPTKQRAVLASIILALETAIQKRKDMMARFSDPPVSIGILVKIFLDAGYVYACMTQGIEAWRRHGWKTMTDSFRVLEDQDLFVRAAWLCDAVRGVGTLAFTLINEFENIEADRECNLEADRMYRESIAADQVPGNSSDQAR